MNHEFCYLEDLYTNLITDIDIKKVLDPSSFYFETTEDITADSLRKNCPNGKAVWIIPGEVNVKANNRAGCNILDHEFDIVLFLECTGRQFEFTTDSNGELAMDGMYISLSKCRNLFKCAIDKINCSMNEVGSCHGKFYFQGATRIEKINGYLVGGLRYKTELFKL